MQSESLDHSSKDSGPTDPIIPRGLSGAFFIHGLAFSTGIGLQHMFMQFGIADSQNKPTWAALMGLLAFVVVVGGGFISRWRRFFSNIRFAVAAIASATLLCILGTVILQNQSQAILGAAYDSMVLGAIQALFLDDIFHSFGFVIVLAIGAGGLALVSVRRRRLRVLTVGSVASHLGILLLLAGSAVGMVWEVRGYINLHEGASIDHFEASLPGGMTANVPLGFVVRLDDFKLELYEPEFRLYLYESDGARQKILAKIDPENPRALSDHGLQVVDYWPDYEEEIVVEVLDRKPDGEGLFTGSEIQPAMAFVSVNGSATKKVHWIFDYSSLDSESNRVFAERLVFFWQAAKAEQFVRMLALSKVDSPHVLIVDDHEVRVKVGQSVDIEKLGVQIEVLQVFNDFIIDTKTKKPQNRTGKPKNPAIEISVKNRKDVQIGRQWLFAKHPAFHGNAKNSVFANIGYRYEEPNLNQHINTIAVGESAEIWRLDNAKVVKEEKLEVGKRLDLLRRSFTIRGVYEKTRHKLRQRTRSQRANNPVVKVQVNGQRQQNTLRSKEPVELSEGRFLVLAPKNENDVRDYLSNVTVLEQGKPVLTETVEVNYPLEYRGYSIYQSNYRREDPTYSGFLVVKNPGLWLVFLGLMLNTTGVVVVLFMPPIMKRRRRISRLKKEKRAINPEDMTGDPS